MKRDAAFDVLLPPLQQCEHNVLWVADENSLDAINTFLPSDNLKIISNRFDVADVAMRAGHDAVFSDFDFEKYADSSFQNIVYRVSKEKPVVHHVLNHALRLLKPGGELFIAGLKAEGTKTYIDKCRELFGNGTAEKHGLVYLGHFTKAGNSECLVLLDDQDYSHLRLNHSSSLDFYSKPGLFGWNRIDQGSAFLIETLPNWLTQQVNQPESLLDLGCGYGYLTLMTRDLPLQRRAATDNNAAALLAVRANVAHYAMNVEIVADDAGRGLQERFDLILCNPPFHQGFSVAGDLTVKFLHSARSLLTRCGVALFVVNAFIPLEQKAAGIFSSATVLANNHSFKLIILRP